MSEANPDFPRPRSRVGTVELVAGKQDERSESGLPWQYWWMESTSEPIYEVVWPRSAQAVQQRRQAERLDTLAGKRVAFLWDYVFRGDELFPVLESELKKRFGDIEIMGYETFGNLHGADEKERIGRLPDDLRKRGVDAVVSGMGC